MYLTKNKKKNNNNILLLKEKRMRLLAFDGYVRCILAFSVRRTKGLGIRDLSDLPLTTHTSHQLGGVLLLSLKGVSVLQWNLKYSF